MLSLYSFTQGEGLHTLFSLWGAWRAFKGNFRAKRIKSGAANIIVASFTPQRLIRSATVTVSVSLNLFSDSDDLWDWFPWCFPGHWATANDGDRSGLHLYCIRRLIARGTEQPDQYPRSGYAYAHFFCEPVS